MEGKKLEIWNFDSWSQNNSKKGLKCISDNKNQVMGTLEKTQSIPPIGCMIISFQIQILDRLSSYYH